MPNQLASYKQTDPSLVKRNSLTGREVPRRDENGAKKKRTVSVTGEKRKRKVVKNVVRPVATVTPNPRGATGHEDQEGWYADRAL